MVLKEQEVPEANLELKAPKVRRSLLNYRIVNLLSVILSTSLLAACIAPPPRENPLVAVTATPAAQDPFIRENCGGNYWADKNLDPAASPVIRSVELCFNHDAVLMRLCFTQTLGVYRIIARQMSQQQNSDPGYVSNLPYGAFPNGCDVHLPVWGVETDETDRMMLGQRRGFESNDITYNNVRVYETTRKGNLQDMEVHFLGTENINPESIVPRSDYLSPRFEG